MFLPIILFAAALCVTTAIVTSASRKKIRQRMLKTLASIPDFHATKYILSCDTRACVAFDESRRSLCLLRPGNSPSSVQYQTVRDSQVISVQLFEDGDLIARVARSGARVDALPFDTLMAEPARRSRKSAEINQIELKFLIEGGGEMSCDVRLLDTDCSKDSPLYRAAMSVARGWVGIVESLISGAEKDSTRLPDPAPHGAPPFLVAEDVKKLSELVGSGALTLDEFETAKGRLLGPATRMAPAPTLRSA